jgi:hypothetical protein
MKWKYIGNRTGDAKKGEQYIVEIHPYMERYAKEDDYEEVVSSIVKRVNKIAKSV